jgi:hypothetical protein
MRYDGRPRPLRTVAFREWELPTTEAVAAANSLMRGIVPDDKSAVAEELNDPSGTATPSEHTGDRENMVT